MQAQFGEQKATKQRADEANNEITKYSTWRIGDLGREVARDQPDQDPGQHAHVGSPALTNHASMRWLQCADVHVWSYVQHPSVRIEHRLLHHFRESRMR